VLAACATTTGGVLSAYSYVSPLLTDQARIATGLVPLVLVGLSANPVLSSLSVRFAGAAPTFGVAMSVAAYNLGTAVGSWLAGRALGSGLGATGPAAVGAVIAALTLVPTIGIARVRREMSTSCSPSPGMGSGRSTTSMTSGPPKRVICTARGRGG
jgi:predicted MFS family arabinose efflux permease